MTHYNAFISYNHNPRDIRIAALLQSQLENYKIPKGVKSSSGLSKIERVFLDKGELEVAGDLNKVICDALENTDWLIVICSPESRKSIWVQREIEYFLRNHTLDNILTVITDGEPFDVLPEVLLNEAREPLSCDYRQPGRIARTVELPRLVAALVGCKYDDLVQRQRHYRMRRMTIALTAASVILLSAVTYLIWSNNQIRTNLEMSLKEQSTTLAIQSEQALRSGDRIGALNYAIDALPSDEQDRPIVSQAVRALSSAMNIYKADDATNWKNALRRYPSYGKHHIALIAAEIRGNSYIAELYSNGRCVLWNTDTGEELMAEYTSDLMKSGAAVQNFIFSNDGNLILVTSDSIRIVDPETGSEVRTIALDGEYFKIFDYYEITTKCDPLLVEGDSLWIPVATASEAELPDDYSLRTNSTEMDNAASVFGRDSDEISQLVLNIRRHDISEISFRIQRIDLKTGKTEAETAAPMRPAKIMLSPNGKYLVCSYSRYYDSMARTGATEDKVTVYNAEDLSNIGSVSSTFISDAGFDNQDRLVLCGYDELPEGAESSLFSLVNYTIRGSNRIYTFSSERNLELKCFDPDTCSELWSQTRKIHASGVPWLAITEKESLMSNAVICAAGNNILITDADGKEIETLSALSSVVKIGCPTDSLIAVLDDGELTVWRYNDHKLQAITEYNVLLGPVTDYVAVGKYAFTVSTDSDSSSSQEILTQYDESGIDPQWEAYEYDSDNSGTDAMKPVDTEWLGDSFVEIRMTDAASNKAASSRTAEIIVRDISSGSIVHKHNVDLASFQDKAATEDNKYKPYRYSGIDRERGKVYFLDNDSFLIQTLLSVDLETGKEEKVTLNVIPAEDVVKDDKVPILYDILSPIDLYSAYEDTAGIFSIEKGHIYYAAMEGSACETEEGAQYLTHIIVLEVDPDTGETAVHRIISPLDEFENSLYVKFRINAACDRLISSDDSRFTAYGFDGKTIWSGEELPYEPAGFTCADDGTVIALENGGSESVIHVYSPQDGSEKASISLGAAQLLSHEKMDCMNISDEDKLIVVGDDAFLVDNITWELRSSISDSYIAYNPQVKQFMLGLADERMTGHVPYRTLEEMITEAGESMDTGESMEDGTE